MHLYRNNKHIKDILSSTFSSNNREDWQHWSPSVQANKTFETFLPLSAVEALCVSFSDKVLHTTKMSTKNTFKYKHSHKKLKLWHKMQHPLAQCNRGAFTLKQPASLKCHRLVPQQHSESPNTESRR